MSAEALAIGLLITAGVLLHRVSNRLGMPVLLAFIALGLFVGVDGPLHISFENYPLAETLCTTALIAIMFYGGFGTSWPSARPVALPGALLATVGVALTAAITGIGCHFLLGTGWLESLLLGSVLASTDAASVYSILRSKRLGLKHRTDSLLEIESGSNDPMAFMLTTVILSMMDSGPSPLGILTTLLSQFTFGAVVGVLVGVVGVTLLRRLHLANDGIDMVFLLALALIAWAGADTVGGNGFLATYLAGIILGNSHIDNQKGLVSFFDGITATAQMALFFTLGLLATPSRMGDSVGYALVVALVLTFVARPLAVAAILTPFGAGWRQQALVSFAGLRGAASIVFAITAVVAPGRLSGDIYHAVLIVVMLSIAVQGTLLPVAARWLGMTDDSVDVLRSFSDWSDAADSTSDIRLDEQRIPAGHAWVGRSISEISPDPGELVVMILRGDRTLVPDGATIVEAGDRLVFSRTTAD